MTFPYWIWAETTGKTTELPFEKFEKTLHTFRGFISLGCYWLKFRNQLGIKQAQVVEMLPEVQSYFSVFLPPWFPTLCPSILKSRKTNSCPIFFVCADFLFAYTPKNHNASPVIRNKWSVTKNNWKYLKPQCKVEYLFSSHALWFLVEWWILRGGSNTNLFSLSN